MTADGGGAANQGDDRAAPTAAPAAMAIAQGKRYAEAIERMRGRSDAAAKTLGALATTAITAVGLEKFSGVFPFATDDAWSWVAVVATVGGFVALAVAVGWFVARLWWSNRPIFMPADLERTEDLADEPERTLVRRIYQEIADLNDAPSLSAYEARGWRLNAIAEQLGSGDPLKARLTAQAATIAAEVSATESRAVLNVVRSRSARVLGASRIWRLPALFVAAVLALGLGSDHLASERADRVSTAKACAEAQKALSAQGLSAVDLLPRLCRPSNAGPSPEVSEPDGR